MKRIEKNHYWPSYLRIRWFTFTFALSSYIENEVMSMVESEGSIEDKIMTLHQIKHLI